MCGCNDCNGLPQEGCADGVGITSTVQNEDSSITFFYSDGSTFTTNPLRGYKSYVATVYYSGIGMTIEQVWFNSLGTTVNWPDVASGPFNRIIPTLTTPSTGTLVAFLTPAGYNTGTYKYFMYAYTNDMTNQIEIDIQNPDLNYPDLGAFAFTIEIREYPL